MPQNVIELVCHNKPMGRNPPHAAAERQFFQHGMLVKTNKNQGVQRMESEQRKNAIRGAYHLTGSNNFYDGMITCSTFSGKAVCRMV